MGGGGGRAEYWETDTRKKAQKVRRVRKTDGTLIGITVRIQVTDTQKRVEKEESRQMNWKDMEDGTDRAGKTNIRDSTDGKNKKDRQDRQRRQDSLWTDRKKGTGTGRPIEQKFKTSNTESITGQTDRQG